MSYANPEYFWLLILIPVYLGLWWWSRRKRQAVWVANFKMIKKSKRWSGWKWLPYVQVLLVMVVISLFSVVLARPQSEKKVEDVKKHGIDIVLALDVSGSMMAEDLSPNRIEAAKESIGKFIENREADRMGVVVFAGKAFTQSPLTFDYAILREYLTETTTETVDQRVRGLSGTAVGDAILAAVNRFETDEEERTKVLILATDGDANVGVDPKLAAQKAAQEGIKIYAIGIGKDGGAPIPMTDALGRQSYATDQAGQILRAEFNEEALKEIADIGGGQYFRADDNESFDAVMQEIDSLEKQDLAVSSSTEYEDEYESYLLGLMVVMIGYLASIAIRPVEK